jgi:uncharacterized protein with PQ loop repeat
MKTRRFTTLRLAQEKNPFSVTRAIFSDSLWSSHTEELMQYYVTRNNQQLGPFTEAEVRAQLAAGTISPQDHVWWQGQQGWIPLAQSSLMTPTAPGVTPPLGIAPIPSTVGASLPTSQLAIWALVCGCISLFCWLIGSIPAIILGHMGMSETKKNPAIPGRGLAMSGMILGYISMTFFVIYIVSIIVFVAMGNNVKEVFKTIQAQENAAQSTNSDQSSTPSDQTTNSDQPSASPTNSPDQSTNSATATPTAPASSDQSTNNSTPSTNAPDSSTNAAPMNP